MGHFHRDTKSPRQDTGGLEKRVSQKLNYFRFERAIRCVLTVGLATRRLANLSVSVKRLNALNQFASLLNDLHQVGL